MSKEHDLKSWPQAFGPMLDGQKNCEFREDDRAFEIGDVLLLREWVPPFWTKTNTRKPGYTGRQIKRRVSHILRGPDWGIPLRFVVMSLVPLTGDES